jgi:hypothetical protein
VQVRQLHGVSDCLDLGVETADHVVADVGDFFEDEILNFLGGPASR